MLHAELRDGDHQRESGGDKVHHTVLVDAQQPRQDRERHDARKRDQHAAERIVRNMLREPTIDRTRRRWSSQGGRGHDPSARRDEAALADLRTPRQPCAKVCGDALGGTVVEPPFERALALRRDEIAH